MTKYLAAFLFLSTALLSSCYYDNEEELYPKLPCDTTNSKFGEIIQPIVNQSCLSGCHEPGGNAAFLILDNYNAIKASVDAGTFQDRVLVKKNMPPSQPLDPCKITLIQRWINNGSQNN